MSRTRSTELMQRDIAIREFVSSGGSKQAAADTWQLSLPRIYQIVGDQYEGISDSEQRNLLLAQIDYLIEKSLETVRNPPQLANAARLVFETDESGKPDYSKPIPDKRAVSDAAKAVKGLMEEKAKLLALYKKPEPPKQEMVTELGTILEDWRSDQARLRMMEARLALYENKGIEDAEVVKDPPPSEAG